TPTRIYVEAVRAARGAGTVRALAHITGGGLSGNLPRVLGARGAVVDLSAWPLPPVFRWLRDAAGLDDAAMLETFNCGIGMVAVVPDAEAGAVAAALEAAGEEVRRIGRITKAPGLSIEGRLG
ncbi:MAG TPA: AIR synthase-related protein, partial [Thermohalobaculum sp.]|nr:AIR synthase-related protein [Thermohalobaculum sp.]